ncbi:MAG: OmpA family protein [Flavobacterium sp.]
MKTNFKSSIGTCSRWSFHKFPSNYFVVAILVFFIMQTSMRAQEIQYSKPSWWFGAAVGSNFNFYRGSTQVINENFTPPTAFHNGFGVALYAAPLVEYHRPNSYWGFMLQTGYDNRSGQFNQVITPCNCPTDLEAKLSYITIEPSVRLAPFKSNFYLYAGPRVAFNIEKSFTYQLRTNPDYPLQATSPEVSGDFSSIEKTIFSMQIGMGYDFFIGSQVRKTQFVFSPFVAFHPYFGANPRTIETWNITTLRAGFALKFGSGTQSTIQKIVDGEVQFSVTSPKDVMVQNRIREVFPLRNYIFFNLGSTQVPDRYVLLNKGQVKDFKEEQVPFYTPKNMSGRSERQMLVYYNVLNILGDRMQKMPTSTIKLVGSSEKGPEEGREMAEVVKNYLATIFTINGARITTEGRIKPLVPSEQPGGKLELELLREGDRRVTIESNSPELLMEFQSGDAPLKPIEIVTVEQLEHQDDITFNAKGSSEVLKTWQVELKDEKGKIKNFGPYIDEVAVVSRKEILSTQQQGNFNAVLVGQTKSGKTVRKDARVTIVPFVEPQIQESIRFSVIYEFNESKSVLIYEKYLSEIVTPKIPIGGKVIIQGHTDSIGEEEYNQKLSLARANDVKTIIEKSLANAGRSDVKFEIAGYGEDVNHLLFENKFPEGRFYNRTVVIEIVPNR